MPGIRKATIQDIPLIRQLTFAIWPQTYRSIISQEQIDYMLEMMYSPKALKKQMEDEACTFIVVSDENEPVGFASYAPLTEPGGHPADNGPVAQIWKLHKIYVLSSEQGKGTGKFIINYIIEELKQQQVKALQLQVNRHNHAKDFYEKLGFTVINTADFDIGHGYFMNDYVMELSL